MVSLLALLAPLLSLWLWSPLIPSHRRAFWWCVAITTVLGTAPALLIYAMRNEVLDFGLLSHLQLVSGTLFAAIALGLVLCIVRDLLWLAVRAWRGPRSAAPWRRPRWTATGMVALVLLSTYGTIQGTRLPEVREHTVTLPRLPAALDGLRIAVLADIHASPVNDASYVQTIVQRTLATTPDLIVLPGDMVDGDVATSRPHVAPLAALSARYGVWAAPGNHEYYSGYNAWMAEFRRLGLSLLENRMQLLNIKGSKLALSGIGDPVFGRTSPNNADPEVAEGVPPDVDAVAAQARKAGAAFHILLAHQPKFAHDNAAKGVNLQISGHTHGGLILGMDRWLVAPVNNGFVRGEYDVGNMKLLVSSGAGLWAGFAIRLGVAPRIELLTLVARQ